ncbi:type II toxin-antitoxin system ParD family antitoxin [Parasphingorhabdus sp.]|uniref:type II toxin-antitoxin system ParD family antitoxin n=1 Tax=Parasphingorhabdus sp. TaxID=2709688 RepID=UPI003002E12B
MSKNTSISLSDHHLEFIHKQVKSGRYGSTSEVIRDALRMHEERTEFRSKLIESIDRGLASPVDTAFDIDRWFDDEFGEACED